MSDYDGVCTNDCDNGEPCNGWHYKCCDFGTSAVWFEKNDLKQQNNNKMKQEKWYVGQKVWDKVNYPGQIGKVEAIDPSCTVPIKVRFNNERDSYTIDGGYIVGSIQVLYPYPHRIEIHRIEPEFEKGQIVLVRDLDTEYWNAARFVKRSEAGYICADIYPDKCFADWKQCIPFEGNEHLLLTTDMP